MKKKHLIGVRDKIHLESFKVVKRVLEGEAIGNFNPIFCRYKNRQHLVMSTEGDLSDPFRRTEEYLDHLYIEV